MSRFAAIATPTLKPTTDYPLGHSDSIDYEFKSQPGLTSDTVRQISAHKHEPAWMLEFRLKSLAEFNPPRSWRTHPLIECAYSSKFAEFLKLAFCPFKVIQFNPQNVVEIAAE